MAKKSSYPANALDIGRAQLFRGTGAYAYGAPKALPRMDLNLRFKYTVRGSERETPSGDAIMARRRKTPHDDYALYMLTWLFAGLVVVAGIAGLIGRFAH
jgi:hypothetical protein